MQVSGEEGEKEENEEIALARSLKTKGGSEEDDDNLDSAPSAARSGWVEEGDDDAATQTQTHTQPQGGASEGATAGEDEVMLDSDNEEAAPEAPRLSKDELRRQEMIKRAKKQGKSLYQLQVEDEKKDAPVAGARHPAPASQSGQRTDQQKRAGKPMARPSCGEREARLAREAAAMGLPVTQCEKNTRCVRGFKHGGRGGWCNVPSGET